MSLYDIARAVTDEVMGEGTYAKINEGNPDPGVKAAAARSRGVEPEAEQVTPEASEPTYKLTVTYALGHDQAHTGLTEDQMEQGLGAFLSDLTYLKGAGIQRVSVEIEGERDERGGYVPGLAREGR